jgi:hypothetical protein
MATLAQPVIKIGTFALERMIGTHHHHRCRYLASVHNSASHRCYRSGVDDPAFIYLLHCDLFTQSLTQAVRYQTFKTQHWMMNWSAIVQGHLFA